MAILGIETTHPGVYVIERDNEPRIVGVGVNTCGFVGSAEKGYTDRAVFCSSFQQFVNNYGGSYRGSHLYQAVRYFFKQGGTRCYIARAVGAGADPAYGNLQNLGSEPASATVISANASPFNLEPGDSLDVEVDGGAPQSFVFTAAPAEVTGSAFDGVGLNALTVILSVDGTPDQTLLINGIPDPATVEEVAAYLNGVISLAKVTVSGGFIRITSDSAGTAASVEIVGGTALTKLGLTAATTYGTGNVPLIDAVTAATAVSVINLTLTGATATATTTGKVQIQSTSLGATATIQVMVSTTATAFGFDNVVHYGSAASFQNALMITANSEGAWGNQLSISTTAWSTTFRNPVDNADTQVVVSSLRDIKKGDVIYCYDPTTPANMFVNIIYDVDTSTKTLDLAFPVSGLTAQLPAGSVLASSSNHKMSTTTTAILSDGDTQVTVGNTAGLEIGGLVTIMDGTTMTEVIITGIDGNIIKFDDVSLITPIASGALAVSQEFQIQVYEKGQYAEQTFIQLSMMEDANSYVLNLLSGISNRSVKIEVTDLYATPTYEWMKIPRPVVKQSLAGGVDGVTPVDDDYIGSDVDPKTGMYLFDEVSDLNFFAVPGITTTAMQVAATAYAEQRGEVLYVMDCPEWTDMPQEVYNYRVFELNINSSYAALYYPWIEVNDPDNTDLNMLIPPSGIVCGQYARTAATEGVHVPPANVLLRDVIDTQYHASDADQDLLNPVGVNVIRWFPGDGIRIYGCRTLWNTMDGRQYVNVRRLLNYVKASLRIGNRWVIMKVNDPRLWDQVEQVNNEFMYGLWTRGMLFPSNDVKRAYYVKCDAELNPDSERKDGRLNMEIGLNPPLPVEFFVISLGLWYDGSSVTEGIA